MGEDQASLDTRFRQIESTADLLHFQVDGWCIWPLLHFTLYYRFISPPSNPTAAFNQVALRERLSLALNDFARMLFLPSVKYVIMVQSSNRAEQVGGLYKDIYFDDILPELKSIFKIENLVNLHYAPRMQAALIPSAMTTMGIKMLTGGFMKMGLPVRFARTAVDLSRAIIKNYALEEYSPARLQLAFKNFYWSKRLYRNILQRIRPRALLLTTAVEYISLVAAAKELGIRVIEFQHGLINRHHTAYSWTKYALPYKKHMPLPDQIFVYGDYWRDELVANGFWDEEIRSVGSLRIDQYRQQPRRQESTPFTILITTQNEDTTKLVRFLDEFLDIAKERLCLRLVVKLHPAEGDKNNYRILTKHGDLVTILLGSESPSTFSLLNQSNLHISIYSTCHYEALGLGVPTAILPLYKHEMVLHLVETGHAYLIQSPTELLNAIEEKRFQPIMAQIGDRFFKQNAKANILRELGS